jgi:hypothetical protein
MSPMRCLARRRVASDICIGKAPPDHLYRVVPPRFHAFGKRTINVVPSLADDRTSMVPRCAAMISLQM